ncbi:50S ribosomal protein L10 [Ammoniphilus oxalaticus]|uniref:Large ribosomal subunit protein uL10 n=1 Tax=Ammoniphilus oxalaticus TaxID=66863 RepID=A0A419SG34_9BACL|nr:50S ribosomal protein L10 [Ammoniphilus oxalaticus]
MGTVAVREQKVQTVQEIASKIREAKSTVLTDYRGLTVAQVTELRKLCRDAGVEFKVYKNKLAQRATAEVGVTELDEYLVGPTAIAFAEDEVTAAKILNDFSKSNDKLELKGGIVDGKVMGEAELKELASLPPREGLVSMLLSVLQAPVRNFALAVKAVSDKQEEEA